MFDFYFYIAGSLLLLILGFLPRFMYVPLISKLIHGAAVIHVDDEGQFVSIEGGGFELDMAKRVAGVAADLGCRIPFTVLGTDGKVTVYTARGLPGADSFFELFSQEMQRRGLDWSRARDIGGYKIK